MSSAKMRSPNASTRPGSAPGPPLWPGTWKRPGLRAAYARSASRYGVSDWPAKRAASLGAEVAQDGLNGRRRRLRRLDAVYLPRTEAHHPLAGLGGEGDLGGRAVGAADGDQGVRGPDDERVARLAQAGRDRDVHERVGSGAVGSGQDPDRRAAGFLRAPAGGLHDASQSAAHQGSATRCEPTADLLGGRELVGARLAGAGYGDVDQGRGGGSSATVGASSARRAGAAPRSRGSTEIAIRAVARTAPATISAEPPSASQMPMSCSRPPGPATAGGAFTTWVSTMTSASTATASGIPAPNGLRIAP